MSVLNRRDFVTRTACAGAGLALSGRVSAALQPAASGMFVSLNGALTPKVGGLDKIRLAAKTGYGGVDWDLGPANTAGHAATKALFAGLGARR